MFFKKSATKEQIIQKIGIWAQITLLAYGKKSTRINFFFSEAKLHNTF